MTIVGNAIIYPRLFQFSKLKGLPKLEDCNNSNGLGRCDAICFFNDPVAREEFIFFQEAVQ
ncbi:MAG: hypothetical protein A2053_05490 [Deltaproteobacteria bacterium GWA2_50_8]|nr:MAG: hypothetical protein A2053_05490 [Deltaproteobacteria bacterium GWA2_50_8]